MKKAVVAALVVTGLAGCIDFGMCGPTLMGAEGSATVQMAWTAENRTLARDALQAQGFRPGADESPPWGFTLQNATDLVSVSDQGSTLRLTLSMSPSSREFDSQGEAERAAEPLRARFDHFLARFLADTRSDLSGPPTFEPRIAVC